MVQFGTGSLMSVMPNGSYYLYHAEGFNVEVDEHGQVTYIPNPSIQVMSLLRSLTLYTYNDSHPAMKLSN